MRRYTIILLLMAGFFHATASNDSINAELERANQLYRQEHYDEAAAIYSDALEFGSSALLYYNLGNCYYKMNESGLAILNYERALRLKPNFRNARYNLKLAEERLIDDIDSSPGFWVRRISNVLVNSLSSNGWGTVGYVFLLLFLSGFLLFVFGQKKSLRKVGFNGGIIALLIFLTSFSFSAIRKKQFINHNEAVILQAAVMVKNAPDQSGTDLFELHEGTKVLVKSTLDGWSEIKLENGAIGWLESTTIERI